MEEDYITEINADEFGHLRKMVRTQGAFADFNGDGAGDFCVLSIQRFHRPNRMAIFAGNPDWELSALEDYTAPKKFQLNFETYPNPFNERVIVQMKSTISGQLELKIYDLNGRVVEKSIRSIPAVGDYSYSWDASGNSAGIYFLEVIVETGAERLYASQKLLLIP